jgi:hypothetical protein
MVCPAYPPFPVEPRLSLSEIEARLTPETMWAAEDAYDYAASVANVEIEETLSQAHRAWLDVILAALGKEQS